MADSIKLPVQLIGIEKEWAKIQQVHGQMLAKGKSTAAALASSVEASSRAMEDVLRKQGVNTGRFQTPLLLPQKPEKAPIRTRFDEEKGWFLEAERRARGAGGKFTGAREWKEIPSYEVAVTANMEQLTKKRLSRISNIVKQEEQIEKKNIRDAEKVQKDEERRRLDNAKLAQTLADQEKQLLLDQQKRVKKDFIRQARGERLGQDLTSKEGRKTATREEYARLQQIKRSYAAGVVDEDYMHKAQMDYLAFRNKAGAARSAQVKREANEAKQAAQQQKQAARERSRSMSQATMGVASAGIGLFGQAGFPLLNIAFASMSGMQYAGVAAVATAAGEAARAIITLQDAAKQAAQSIGFMTREFKFAKAQTEGWKAAWGGILEPSDTRAMKDRMETWKIGGGLDTSWRMFNESMNRFKNFFLAGKNTYQYSAYEQTKRDQVVAVEDLLKQRREFVRKEFSLQSSFEAPEQMWRRMQEAAASRGPDDLQLKRETLKAIDEQIKNAKAGVEASKKLIEAIERDRKGVAPSPRYLVEMHGPMGMGSIVSKLERMIWGEDEKVAPQPPKPTKFVPTHSPISPEAPKFAPTRSTVPEEIMRQTTGGTGIEKQTLKGIEAQIKAADASKEASDKLRDAILKKSNPVIETPGGRVPAWVYQ